MGDVARENVQKLEERGRKLQDLGDKAAGLEDAAADFASMAKQLEKKMGSGRGWW